MTALGITDSIEIALLSRIIVETVSICNYIIKNEEGQEGGVLCVANPECGSPILMCFYGETSRSELGTYIALAREKALRLASHPGDWSSWQSRNLNANQYAGALKVGKFILSFSGFKEEQDEAAMLVLAMNVGLMDGGPAAMIAQMSKNEYFRKLQNACGVDSKSTNPLDHFRLADEKHP